MRRCSKCIFFYFCSHAIFLLFNFFVVFYVALPPALVIIVGTYISFGMFFTSRVRCNWTACLSCVFFFRCLADCAFTFVSFWHGLPNGACERRIIRRCRRITLSVCVFAGEQNEENQKIVYNRRIQIGPIKWLQDCSQSRYLANQMSNMLIN